MSYSPPRPTGQAERKVRVLTGFLAVAALVAALVALWQTQSTPLARRTYCWGAWTEGAGPFRDGGGERAAEESVPTRERPRGHCVVSWRGGRGAGAYEQRIEVRLGTGPSDVAGRREWVGGLFAGGDRALPGLLPGFTADGSGALVLPESCDVGGRPSVVTLTSSFTDAVDRGSHPGFPEDSPARTGELLVRAANRATETTRCSEAPSLRLRPEPLASSTPPAPDAPAGRCAIPGLGEDAAGEHLTDTVAGGAGDDLQSCAVAEGDDGRPAARFTMVGRPRIVALFDGLTGDSPPAPGWRGRGRMDAAGALLRAECDGRPTVFAMRVGPGRTHTRLDDPRRSFPAFVDAVAARIGCAPLHTG
ncbi:hypothetical protein [Streptomyces eurocidicus]|uniref:Uncharacterized protein n=1 Tax=Streptomyces eurocidicus TaxID=66423 RepID=A0A7W8EZ15_STREU|nr:hypothetical protein [Streptomyces eurocidicus]MBB5117138.1 hypothetical protein [Streptomyces eurocidicus]MBF6052567.1 hypothetical protein [Streptomyces eurocidicus]